MSRAIGRSSEPTTFALSVLWHMEQVCAVNPGDVPTACIGQRLWPWQIAFGAARGGPDASGVAAGFQLPRLAAAGLIERAFGDDSYISRYRQTRAGLDLLEEYRSTVPLALVYARTPAPGVTSVVMSRWAAWAAWQAVVHYTHRDERVPGPGSHASIVAALFPTASEGLRLLAVTKADQIVRDGHLDRGHDNLHQRYGLRAHEGLLHRQANEAAARLAQEFAAAGVKGHRSTEP